MKFQNCLDSYQRLTYKTVMQYDVKQITKRRMQKGWSKTRLAKVVAVDPKTITNVERGSGGKPETIKAIADALGISMKELVLENDAA